MKRGQQIIYIPTHAGGDKAHKDCERGFVSSIGKLGNVFCRYWDKRDVNRLRTLANSESTPIENLRVHYTHPQKVVDDILNTIDSTNNNLTHELVDEIINKFVKEKP